MPIVYTGPDGEIFRVVERYQVDEDFWIRYTNSQGKEFTCREEAFYHRFSKLDQT